MNHFEEEFRSAEKIENNEVRYQIKEILEKVSRGEDIRGIEGLAILANSSHFFDTPNEEEIVRTAASAGPEWVIGKADEIKGRSYAEEVITKAAESKPGNALLAMLVIKDEPYYEKALKIAAFKAAKTEPDKALIYSDRFKGRDYAEEVIELAAKNAATPYPDSVLLREDLNEKSYYKSIKKEALFCWANSMPERVFDYYKEIVEMEEYKDEILRLAVENAKRKNPKLLFKNVHLFRDKDYTESVFLEITKKDPEITLRSFEEIKNESFAQSILEAAMISMSEKDPKKLPVYSYLLD